MQWKRIIWKALFWLNWAFIAWFWFQSSGALLSQGFSSSLVALGRLSGLCAAYFVLMQFVTTGRILWVERSFGMDKLTKSHQRNGKLALFFILLHPILLTYGYGKMFGNGFVKQFVMSITGSDEVFQAFLSFLLFIALVAISLKIVRSKLKYETWYYVHLLMYLAVFFSYEHQFELGSTVNLNQIFYGYWVALYLAVLIAFALFRFAWPIYHFFRHRFRIVRVVRETPTVVSVYISGKNMEKFAIQPGQFMIFRFLNKKMWGQAHPFSLSMLPSGGQVRISVRNLGDFTKSIEELKEGTPVIIEGPYGIFTRKVAVKEKFLLLAGGIGITPLRSLFEELAKDGRDVMLINSAKVSADVPLRAEFERIASEYKKPYILTLSGEPEFAGEKGFIDTEKLRRLVPDIKERDVYICGSVPMMEMAMNATKELGVPAAQIHSEVFSF